MRLALTLCALVAAAAPVCAAPATTPCPSAAIAPPSASILLRARPRAWRPPSAVVAPVAGMRFEPETGPETTDDADVAALRAARARARANAVVRIEADGSRHSVVGGIIRAYTIARVGADGRLEHECVPSEAEAMKRVRAAAKTGGN